MASPQQPTLQVRRRPPLRLVRDGDDPQDGAFDPSDLDGVFRRYAPYVATISLRILGCDDDIDDLVQEVFLDAHRRRSELREASAIRGWLARVTVRKAVRKLRRGKLRRWLALDEHPDYAGLADPSATPEQRAEVVRVYRVLDRVTAEERVAWVLRYVQEYSLDEIAELASVSRSTVQRRIRAAQAAVMTPSVPGGAHD